MLNVDIGFTQAIGAFFQLKIHPDRLVAGRKRIAELLAQRGIDATVTVLPDKASEDLPDNRSRRDRGAVSQTIDWLIATPAFAHLWFLNFLCWFVLGFAIVVSIIHRSPVSAPPSWAITSGLCYAWLIPVTMFAQRPMNNYPAAFGPDTSIGWIPKPEIMIYYAIFFAYGCLYYDQVTKVSKPESPARLPGRSVAGRSVARRSVAGRSMGHQSGDLPVFAIADRFVRQRQRSRLAPNRAPVLPSGLCLAGIIRGNGIVQTVCQWSKRSPSVFVRLVLLVVHRSPAAGDLAAVPISGHRTSHPDQICIGRCDQHFGIAYHLCRINPSHTDRLDAQRETAKTC